MKQIGKLVIFAICLGGLWYILMILGVAFGAPAEVTAAASIPVADVATYVFNSKIFGSLIIVAGIGGILTSWNAMYLGATRILFAMSRAKMLPAAFGKLHPKHNSPTNALLLTGGVGILGALLGKTPELVCRRKAPLGRGRLSLCIDCLLCSNLKNRIWKDRSVHRRQVQWAFWQLSHPAHLLSSIYRSDLAQAWACMEVDDGRPLDCNRHHPGHHNKREV